MRRVIYAWNYREWGGAQIHFLALIKEVRKHFDVLVILPQGSSSHFISFLDDLDVPYEFSPAHMDLAPAPTLRRKLKKHWRKLRSEFAMLKVIAKQRSVDSIVHVDLAPQQSLIALARLSLRTPVFTTSHNALPPAGIIRELIWKIKFLIISRFRNFNVFCSNEDAKKYFRQLYSRGVGDRIEVTYTSIDPKEIDTVMASPFDRAELLGRLGIPTHLPIVLAVGQFIDRKGRWVFLEAGKKVLAKSDCLFLWMTPAMPGAADVEKIGQFGLGDSFRIVRSDAVGPSRQDVLNFFRVADVFALPSFVEGLPIALLEAMALGIPSVSSNVNGIPEAVKNEVTGLLVEAGDPEGLAESIQRLLTDRDFALRLAQSGREFVVENFDERVAAHTVLRSYLKA